MAHAQHVLDAWKQDEWFYCGIVISVWRGCVCLSGNAASLWAIECNYPARLKSQDNNHHLRDVANELLAEAMDRAEEIMAELVA
jgi:hypothetical protein